MAETELERAEKRYAQAKARLQGLKNREATRQRKLDTRRKVILGGALLDLAERDSGAAAMLDRLVRNLAREQDRKAFADYSGRSTAADASSGLSKLEEASVDDNERGIPIDDNLYAALAQQAEANQRTPVEELRAILTAAIAALKASPDNPS